MSLIDYPGNIASVIFTAGCDFRCPFCQNPDLVHVNPQAPNLGAAEVIAALKSRETLVDGVVITGGEPLLHPDLPEFIAAIRQTTGLLIKLDTNGHHPDGLQRLLDEGLVDFVAMDIKTSPARYSEAAGKLVDIDRVMRSVELIKNCGRQYEFRSTVVPGLIDEAAIDEVGKWLQGARLWVLQQFQNRVVLDPKFTERKPLMPDKIRELALRAGKYVPQILIRGL